MNLKQGRLQISTNFYTIYFNCEGFLYIDWTGFQTKNSIYNGCEKMLYYLYQTGVSRVVNDNSNAKGLWDHEWIANDWLPEMEKAGLKKFGWVLSKETLCRNEASLAIRACSVNTLIEAFEDVDTAIMWIRNTTDANIPTKF